MNRRKPGYPVKNLPDTDPDGPDKIRGGILHYEKTCIVSSGTLRDSSDGDSMRLKKHSGDNSGCGGFRSGDIRR